MDDNIPRTASQFATTHWSVVLLAGQETSAERTAALEKLCRAYWQPVCVFARRKGWLEEDAKDLTQQFFADLLARNDFHGLDPAKGKFRTFLLTAFTHFLANEHDRAHALKRGGGKIISLEEALPDEIPSSDCAPATQYDLRWARTILEMAFRLLKEEMTAMNREEQFESLKQFLTANGGADDYAAAAEKLGVKTASVPVLVHRLRQRYRELARNEVLQTVSSPTELAEEMHHLFAVLSQ